jgi:hypothetical protein
MYLQSGSFASYAPNWPQRSSERFTTMEDIVAQRVITVMTDDLDGSEAEDIQTVSFALEGVSYEIDLSQKNSDKLRKALDPYTNVARKVGGRRSTRKAAPSGPSAAEVRAWAQSSGLDVPARGRIPQEVRDAFDAAN